GTTASSCGICVRPSAAMANPASAVRAVPGPSISIATSRTASLRRPAGGIMGEVVAAGLLAHVPTIMLPETIRRELNNGEDFSVVDGLHRLKREVLSKLDYDLVI